MSDKGLTDLHRECLHEKLVNDAMWDDVQDYYESLNQDYYADK